MALLAHQLVDPDGLQIVFSPAAVGGDTYNVDDDASTLVVKDDDAAPKTVTLATPGTYQGLALPDRQVVVAAGAVALVPLSRGLYRDPADGLLDISYSAVTALNVAVIRDA